MSSRVLIACTEEKNQFTNFYQVTLQMFKIQKQMKLNILLKSSTTIVQMMNTIDRQEDPVEFWK